MTVNDFLKIIKNNPKAFNMLKNDVIPANKIEKEEYDKQVISFLTWILIYPICKEKQSEIKNIWSIEEKKIFTFSANCGEFLLVKGKLEGDVSKYSDLPGFEERNTKWEKEKAIFNKSYSIWKDLANAQKEEAIQLVEEYKKVKREKQKREEVIHKIQEFKDKYIMDRLKDLHGQDELQVDEFVSWIKILKDVDSLDKLKDRTFWERKSIFSDQRYITPDRLHYGATLTRYREECIDKCLGEEYRDIDKYGELECKELLARICKNINDSAKSELLEKAYKAYIEDVEIGGSVEMKSKNNIQSQIEDMIEQDIKQIILTGAPGTGKTYSVKKILEDRFLEEMCSKDEPLRDQLLGNELLKDQLLSDKAFRDELLKKEVFPPYEFVQFHSSYDYSDFVEGLRPVQLENTEQPTFVRLDGIFKKFCRRIVEENLKKKYFFVIDEINRADLSRVFGELMFGLEEDYRGEKNAFKTQYHNLPTYQIENGIARKINTDKDVFRNGFYIPENVYIIGTMNDIDRSVEAFDFALRRRFLWVEIYANDVMESALEEMDKVDNGGRMQILNRVKEMNEIITKQSKLGLSEAYQIGGAYFKRYNGNNLEVIWNTKIEPLLREYCRGRNKNDVDDFIKQCKGKLFDSKSDTQDTQGQ